MNCIITCTSLDVLLFVTTCDDNQLCLFHSGNRSTWLMVHPILEIFCVLFLRCFGMFTFLPSRCVFWGRF